LLLLRFSGALLNEPPGNPRLQGRRPLEADCIEETATQPIGVRLPGVPCFGLRRFSAALYFYDYGVLPLWSSSSSRNDTTG
jgi:hypothetical protein